MRVRDHGLDMVRVAVATAEQTIEKAFEILPPLKGPLPSVIVRQPAPSDPELLLLHSIEWTTLMDATYETALEQATVILRYFLGAGRVHVAKILLDMLPHELASFSEPEERAAEYLHYWQVFVVWEILDRVVECQALEVLHVAKETRAAYLSHLFSFHALGEDYHALIRRYQLDVVVTKLEVRREVEVSAYLAGVGELFVEGFSAPRDVRRVSSSFDEPLASALTGGLD